MVDWSLGYSARYYMTRVNWDTMKDIDVIDITGGTIKRTPTELRESADISCVNYDSNEEQIVRVWLDVKQEDGSDHIPLFTGLAACPSNKFKGRRKTNTLECYSMLKVASDILLPRGWYAPVEADSGLVLKDLLSVARVPINFPPNTPTPTLQQSIIAEDGETRLSMADKILDAMGDWRMRMDGYGSIYVEPLSYTETAVFGSVENDVFETDIDVSYDWYSAPNVLRCVLDDSYAEARDEDSDSPLSIQNRGREVWYEDTDVQLNSSETLADYALRMLKYYQQVATTVSYTRRFDPDVYPMDIVRINYPAQEITGLFYVREQSIELGYNARTSEEVTKI